MELSCQDEAMQYTPDWQTLKLNPITDSELTTVKPHLDHNLIIN